MPTRSNPADLPLYRQLTARFVGEQQPGGIAHLLLIALAGVVLFGIAPTSVLLPWVAAVVGTTGIRAVLSWRATRRADPADAAPIIRSAVATVGVIWGLGAAALIPHLPLEYVALLLLVLSGLVAGAVATLAADPLAFRLFVLGALAPLPIAILARDRSRFALAAVFLIVVFGVFVVMMHRRTFHALLQQLRAEAATREARNLAERAAQARVAFLANMSHEIRTPMNAVLGLTELMLDADLPPQHQRSLEMVRTAAETLLALLNDILDFSKIDADQMALESIPFDLRYLVESTVSLLSVRTWGRPIELAADVRAEIPPLVRGDPTRLRQVLTNLIGNAIKFTNEGEVIITVAPRTGSNGSGSGVIAFTVRDTGIGIPPDQIDSIFEEFAQADTSMTRRYGGTGLGLSIAKRLVELMDGELTVASEVGRGSEFSFAIPYAAEPVAHRSGGMDAKALAGQRMLVVDDNATNRRIVREMLGAAAVTVEEASSADAGLAAMRRAQATGAPFALAVIDAQMPGRDGFDLAVAVHGDPAVGGMPLLMLTSAGQRGDAQRCRDVGIEGYLTKPVSRTDLLEMVAALLGRESPAGPALLTRHSMAESRQALRVLLVEDNPINQEVAAAILRKRGHTVDIASTGREAVDAVARGRYDVVLMDVQMPEMDGFEATRHIRATATGADLRIIALTAHALAGEREHCLAQGMSGYLAKPFRPHELIGAVEGFEEGAAPAADAAAVASATPVDLVEFRRTMRDAGAEQAVDGILDRFVSAAPGRLATLTTAVGAMDGPGIARAAHALQSPGGAIGALRLVDLLRELEQAAAEGALDRAAVHLEGVRAETEAVLDYLGEARRSATA